jgi:hypothetical protein
MNYEPASWGTTVGRCQPGCHALLDYFNGKGFTNQGCYNDRPVRGSASVPSLHREGRAVDITPDGNPDGLTALIDLLVWHHEALGVQQVIWQRAFWRCDRDGWHRYSGVNPHEDHAHIEVTWWGAAELTVALLQAHLDPPRIELPERKDQMFQWSVADGNTYLWDGTKPVPMSGLETLSWRMAEKNVAPNPLNWGETLSVEQHNLLLNRLRGSWA